MSINYAKKIATDVDANPIQNAGTPFKAVARYGNTITVSSLIQMTDNTTVLEIGATGGAGLAIRWIPVTETASVSPFASVIASGSTANFDAYIPAGTVRRFVVPMESVGVPSVVGINKQAGLYNRVAVIAATTSASVLATEY